MKGEVYACPGCGRKRVKGHACCSPDCPTFAPINRRIAAHYMVHGGSTDDVTLGY
jgi:hypothetical protein